MLRPLIAASFCSSICTVCRSHDWLAVQARRLVQTSDLLRITFPCVCFELSPDVALDTRGAGTLHAENQPPGEA